MTTAANLVLIGPMGAGKSTLASAVGAVLGRPVRDLDREIEAASSMTIGDIFDRFGEAHFRAQENALLESLLATPGQVLSCGGGVVLAARNRELLAAHAFVIWLDAPIEVLRARLSGDDSRPLLRGVALETRLVELAAQRDALYAESADLRFAVRDESAASQAERLLSALIGNVDMAAVVVNSSDG